jgi:hypothetical protein
MAAQRRWIPYDTFKLIVAIILLLLLLFFTLQRPAAAPAANLGQETPATEPATATVPVPATEPAPATEAVALVPTDTAALPTATVTAQASPTPTAEATATPTAEPQQPTPEPAVDTPTPTAAPASAEQATPTATPQAQAGPADCPLAQPSRLAVGDQAVVITNLNMRQEAGIDKPIIRVGLPNTRMEVIGGPVCTPYQNGAYLWWNVRAPDGLTGWSAEASLSKNIYFLQPIP